MGCLHVAGVCTAEGVAQAQACCLDVISCGHLGLSRACQLTAGRTCLPIISSSHGIHHAKDAHLR